MDEQLAFSFLGAHLHRCPGRRKLQRVVEQVHEDALDLHRIDPDGRRVGVDVGCHALGLWAELLDRPTDELLRWPQLRMRRGDPAVETRQVEQVADDAVEPLRFAADGGDELEAIRIDEHELGIREH